MHNGPCGSYINEHASGKRYFGKGDEKRAAVSADRIAKAKNDPLVKTERKTAASDREAFKDEARSLAADGGPKSDSNYNQIESPGKKYIEEDE